MHGEKKKIHKASKKKHRITNIIWFKLKVLARAITRNKINNFNKQYLLFAFEVLSKAGNKTPSKYAEDASFLDQQLTWVLLRCELELPQITMEKKYAMDIDCDERW